MIYFLLYERLPDFSVLFACPYSEPEAVGSALLAVLYVHCSVYKDSVVPAAPSCVKQAINRSMNNDYLS